MRISKNPNVTPKSDSSTGSQGRASAGAGDEEWIWRSLVPRLIHPARLEVIEALIDKGSPMTVEHLTPVVQSADANVDLVRYHVLAMTEAGVLEVASVQVTASDEVPCFYFRSPSTVPGE